MAKRWLLNLLTKVLGEFVELNETNLNLAVWSGQIVLKNVSLKTDKLLREFNFKVYHGVIQQLEVTIPWTTLLINPVKIVVKGVLLDVGPLDISQHSMVERIQRFLEEKMRKIKMLEKYLDLYLSLDSEHASSGGAEAAKKGSEESSYYQQWTTKIVDNIEVKISQVHVRYEDKLSVPDRCFACGITFQSYGISTLDADWNPSSSTSTAGAASVYKLAYMKSVGVYWQPDATSISHLPLREWQELMMHMIYNSTNLTLQDVNLPPYSKTPASSMQKGLLTSDASLVRDLGGRSSGSGLFDAAGINDDDDDDDSNHHVLPVISREAYLLLPYNNTFTLKMIHNKKPVGNTPRFDVAASSSKLKVAFDSTQYVQLFAIIDRIHALGKVHLPFGLRPRERPVGYDMVRAWWQYAAKLVIKEKKYVSLMKRKMKWLACERKKKLEEENGSKPDPANIERITREMRMYALTQREQRELDEMDMRVPFGSIRVFRQNAALQLAEEARRKRESETSAATSNGTSWLGSWLGYKDTPVVPHSTEKDIPIGSIVQALNNSDGNGSNPSSSSNLLHGDAASIGSGTLVKLKLTTSSQLSIFSRAVPIIESTTAVSLSFAKCTEGMSLSVNLNDFEVLDKFTASPTMPHLISVQKTSVAQLSQRVLPRHQFSDSIDGSRAFAKGVLSTDSSDELRDQKATCSVSFDKVDDKSVLTIAALPITLCLNHDCIFKLFTDFSRPPNRHAKKHTRRSSTNLHAKDAQRTPRQPHAAPGEDRDRTRGRKTSTPAKFQRTATAKVFKQMIPTEAAAFEIIFEANAPKIIVPEDCCSERGFLLMDTGYLVMKGAVGSGGMTLNLSLADIHAALPRTVQDMNSIREKSLYLIKPFDIALRMQNVDQHIANMTIDCEVHPELRGEIDSVKLARLLAGLGQISSMFSRPPSLPNRSSNNSSGQLATSTMNTPSVHSRKHAGRSSDNIIELAADAADALQVQGKYSREIPAESTHGADAPASTEGFSNTGAEAAAAAATVVAAAGLEQQQQQQELLSHQDVEAITLLITVTLPAVALDLMYDVEQNYKLVLEVKSLQSKVTTRMFDRRLELELREVSVQDSFRADAQRDLCWTPPECDKLIYISHTVMLDTRSPYFKTHGTEVIANFANLGLNVDVNTLMHLRPFFEVLLSRRGAEQTAAGPAAEQGRNSGGQSPPPALSDTNDAIESRILSAPYRSILQSVRDLDSNISQLSSTLPVAAFGKLEEAAVAAAAAVADGCTPKGMLIKATLSKISLDILRASTTEQRGTPLESAFSMQVSDLHLHIDMQELMKAEVTLNSFEIIDIRTVSKDYVFRKVFCPASASAHSGAEVIRDDFLSDDSECGPDGGAEHKHSPADAFSRRHGADCAADSGTDLLTLSYNQESKTHSYIEIDIANITSFVAIDTILDLTNVASANFFAMLALLKPPDGDQAAASAEFASKGRPTGETDASRADAAVDVDVDVDVDEMDALAALPLIDKSAPQVLSNTMNVVVKVRNPRLLLLEDPASPESKAIAGSCAIEVHYTREGKSSAVGTSQFESLHVTTSQLEVFVLNNITSLTPMPILLPIEVECHLKKKSVNDIMAFLNVQVEVDDVEARVTISDLLLAQSILNRRMLTETSAVEVNVESDKLNGTSATQYAEDAVLSDGRDAGSDKLNRRRSLTAMAMDSVPQGPPRFDFQFGMSSMNVVAVNDFGGQNVPILKLIVNNSRFNLEKNGDLIAGDGSFTCNVDFYNVPFAAWEPLLEVWRPCVRIYNMEGKATILEVKSDHTMQITVSGTLLQTLLRSYAQLFQEHDEDGLVERSVVSQIEVHNFLGDDVPVQLYDSATKKLLISLDGGGSGTIDGTKSTMRGGRSWNQNSHLPTAIDVQFQGPLRHQRMPLFHLPLNIHKPKAFNLHPTAGALDSFGSLLDAEAAAAAAAAHADAAAGQAASDRAPVGSMVSSAGSLDDATVFTTVSGKQLHAAKVHVMEPIVEEVYENSRYDPISGTWRQPYMMNDPYEWTDASSLKRRDIGSVSLNTVEWEWQGKWEVDMDGVIGEEIDKEGWEYAPSFNSFSVVNPRRTKKAMDAVRRRRWVRTRIPSALISSPSTKVLTLFWDIQAMRNGSKRVELRSALQVVNGLSFAVHILLAHNTWSDDVVLGPIPPGETMNVPLLLSYANCIRFRPDFPLYNWSAVYSCHAQAYDFRSVRDASSGGADVQATWFRIITEQENRSVKVRLAPFITIANKLLCPLSFKCVVQNKTSEEGHIASGSSFHLSNINGSDNPSLLIKVGKYGWSNVVPINASTYPHCLFELGSSGGRRKVAKLYLSMNAKVGPEHGVEVDVFSKIAVLDKTGLDAYIGSKLRPHTDIVRPTCNPLIDLNAKPAKHSSIAAREKQPCPEPSAATSSSSSCKVGAAAPAAEAEGVESAESSVNGSGLKMSGLELLTPPRVLTDYGLNVTLPASASPPLDAYCSPRGKIGAADGRFSTYDENDLISPDDGAAASASALAPALSSASLSSESDRHTNPVHHFELDAQNISSSGGAAVGATATASAGSESLVAGVEVRSQRKYELLRCSSPNSVVYTDRTTRWSYLPPGLHHQLQLRTPFDDKLHRSTRLIKFRTASQPCVVYLLLDIAAKLPWLKADGYHRLSEIATARRVHRGSLEEFHYAVYGKCFDPHTEVVLRSSWNKQAPSMYTVFIVPYNSTPSTSGADIASAAEINYRVISQRSMQRQVEFSDEYSDELATRSWSEGANHMALVYSYDNMITVGLCRGTVWSEEINIDTRKNSVTKGSFEVDNQVSHISYQLSYTLQNMPGPFSETQLVTLMPRYCILNCTSEPLMVSQCGSEKYLEFLPYRPEGWHKLDLELGTELQWRSPRSLWSLGSVDINDIGTSVLYLPHKDYTKSFNTISGTIIHIEVKLATPSDKCSILVVVWEEMVSSHPTMMIRNKSAVPIVLRQAEIEADHDLRNRMHLFEYRLAPNITLPFGWADPESGSDVLIAVGESLQGPNARVAQINLLKADQMLRLPYSFGKAGPKGEVLISVTRNNSGNCLEINRIASSNSSRGNYGIPESGAAAFEDDAEPRQQQGLHQQQDNGNVKDEGGDKSMALGINFLVSSFGVSLVVEKPHRREFLSLYVDWLEVYASVKGTMRSLEFMIRDLQVDNYSETMIYPVLLRSTKKEVHKSVAIEGETDVEVRGSKLQSLLIGDAAQRAEEGTTAAAQHSSSMSSTAGRRTPRASSSAAQKPEKPFVKFTLIQEFPSDGSKPILRYVAFRMLSLAVEVDSATVRLLFTDLLDDLKILTNAQMLAQTKPQHWLRKFNQTHLYPEQRLMLIDSYRSKMAAQKSKMYIKKLIAHPVKVTVTFVQITFPRRQRAETLQSTFLNVVSALVGVEKLQLRLRSFEVEDAMESWNSLYDLILSKSIHDLRSQLTQIAGSLTMLGSPIGFARKVGRGVKAFFYEPYQGAVHSSQDFFIGLRKGTKSLLTGVVAGAMDSTAAIVGTASKGISYLSGDADYVRKRAVKRQQNRANRGGILDGIKDGGESVISGISSGVTGLVAKPMQEASKGGVQGFFRGLGLGLIGAAVKPVMGISDGITSVAYGISNSVDPNARALHVRPPRALEPCSTDPANLIIVPLNLEAAAAQEFVVKRAKSNHYDDAFLSFIPLKEPGEAVVLSEVYIYWKKANSLWGRVWANVSHCVYMGTSVGVMLYSGGENNTPSLKVIPCGTVHIAKKVYAALALNAARMGNPSNVIPVDVVQSIDENSLLSTGNDTASSPQKRMIKRMTSTALARNDGGQKLTMTSELMQLFQDTNLLGTLDGYRFGSANGRILRQITGSEADILQRGQHYLERPNQSWQDVDDNMWQLLWEWGCVHNNLSSCRCCVTLLINRSESPLQISRVQLVMGRSVLIIGAESTGYETESRSILPNGRMIVFISAFPESPINIGHLKANINTASFSAVVASSQRESLCEAKGGFSVGFLEKTVTEWWSKYVIVVS